MNRQRRKQLDDAIAKLEEAKRIIEAVRDEEQEAFDAQPEGIQGGERGEKMEHAIEVMSDVADDLEEAIESIREAAE